MTGSVRALIVACSLLVAASGPALSATDACCRGGGWGPGAPYMSMYDSKTVESIQGVVQSVERIRPMRRMSHGVAVQVKTANETIEVHLGPSWYLDHQDVKIGVNDAIEVKGSRVTLAGKPVLLAAEVTKGDLVLRLRDANGMPAWAGWHRRGPRDRTTQSE